MTGDSKILERYQDYWAQYSDGNDFGSMAKVLRAVLHFFGDDISQCDWIEQMADLLEMRYLFMDLEDFTQCAKAVTYARRKVSTTRGTVYASGLSRRLTESELAIVRGAGAQNGRSGPESDGNGDESVSGFVGNLRADGDDSD